MLLSHMRSLLTLALLRLCGTVREDALAGLVVDGLVQLRAIAKLEEHLEEHEEGRQHERLEEVVEQRRTAACMLFKFVCNIWKYR